MPGEITGLSHEKAQEPDVLRSSQAVAKKSLSEEILMGGEQRKVNSYKDPQIVSLLTNPVRGISSSCPSLRSLVK